MKKTLTIVALIMIIAMLTLSGVNAASKETLASDLLNKLQKYGMTEGDKVEVQRYLDSHEVTDEQANEVLAQADELVELMVREKVDNVSKLPQAAKDEAKGIISIAANQVGVSVVFENDKITLKDANGVITTVSVSESGKLSYTGNNVNTILVVSSVAVIALAAVVVAKKTLSKVGA